MNQRYDFKGQVALVTGAGGGIGLAAANAFATAGADVVWGPAATPGRKRMLSD